MIFKKYEILKNFQILLLCFFPASIIAGPFVSEIILNTTNIIFLYSILRKKDFSFFKIKYFLYFLFFYIYINFITYFSEIADQVIINTLSYIRFIIFDLHFTIY